jgi:hypothetical protein
MHPFLFPFLRGLLYECSYPFELSDLTYEALTLFSNRSLNYSLIMPGLPHPNPYFQLGPAGTTLVTEDSTIPTLLRFESSSHFSGLFHHFAPGVVFSFSLLRSLLSIPVNESLLVISANVTFSSNHRSLRIVGIGTDFTDQHCHNLPESETKMAFIYRTFTGHTTGRSRTIIKLPSEKYEFFEPLPTFCVVDYNSLTTNCSSVSIARDGSGLVLQVQPSPPVCEYSYLYRCRFLRWDEFPTNPDRGFILGPVIANNRHGILTYGNAPTLVLPTPDFSMVYNTPMIAGLVFSIAFSLLGRALLHRDSPEKQHSF